MEIMIGILPVRYPEKSIEDSGAAVKDISLCGLGSGISVLSDGWS